MGENGLNFTYGEGGPGLGVDYWAAPLWPAKDRSPLTAPPKEVCSGCTVEH